ncbi:hypothetical protein [Albimonas pacifica]|uniref:Uncharacterized protein n=1 Tax=Albimonas pacifica TaxID=1114924 RepID=A0A1I3F1Q9_9RHOB|nr:hypothetical protein [Albimonas pacifica]SFI05093.1 hypothetical protein SAMN05216258_1045 [Albimonas pacifica]
MPRDGSSEDSDRGDAAAGKADAPRPRDADVGMAMPIPEADGDADGNGYDQARAAEDPAPAGAAAGDRFKAWLDELVAELGERVVRIYVCTDQYMVFSTEDRDAPSGDGGLRALRYAVRHGDGRAFRERYHGLSSDVAAMVTAIVGARPVLPLDVAQQNYEAIRERSMWQAAQAVAAALDGSPEVASGLISRARAAIETYRDSIVRSRYLVGASVALALCVILAAMFSAAAARFFGPLGAPDEGLPAVANLLLTGAVGSYFSVIYALGKVKVDHAISLAEMVVLGASRIATGAIAAGVAVLLIQGGWIMAGVDAAHAGTTLLLFAFLAGFSEMFIPNALKETEGKSAAAPPPASPPG